VGRLTAGHLGVWPAGAATEPKRREIRSAAPKLSAMRVRIDFDTTHTVAAVVDRGNYPVASFVGVDGWPSVIAANQGELRFGLDAAAVRHDPDGTGLPVTVENTTTLPTGTEAFGFSEVGSSDFTIGTTSYLTETESALFDTFSATGNTFEFVPPVFEIMSSF